MHSQSQTIQEPFSAEFASVCLHPTVQLPVGKGRGQVDTDWTEDSPSPHRPTGFQSNPQGGKEEVVRGGRDW